MSPTTERTLEEKLAAIADRFALGQVLTFERAPGTNQSSDMMYFHVFCASAHLRHEWTGLSSSFTVRQFMPKEVPMLNRKFLQNGFRMVELHQAFVSFQAKAQQFPK